MSFLDDAWDHAAMIGSKVSIWALRFGGRWACRLEDDASGRPVGYGQSPELAAASLMQQVNDRLERARVAESAERGQ